MTRAVVYPLKVKGSKNKNLELRLSLRSLEKNLKEDIPVYVISARRPKFLSSKINFIKVRGYMDALASAADLADEILWMNDDIYFLQSISFDYFKKWRRTEKPYSKEYEESDLASPNGWNKRRGLVTERLRKEGYETYGYDTHTPYLYETEKLKELLGDGWNFGYKTSIETAYGNVYSPPLRERGDKIMVYNDRFFWGDNVGDKLMLNHNERGFSSSLQHWLQSRFPESSKYERRGGG